MNSKPVLLFIICLIACFPQMSSDIYAPSLSIISKSLSVDINLVQLSMAVFMIGFAASQLVYGPLSEGYGRKPIFIGSLLIVFVGSALTLLATNIEMLLAGRIIQGLGAGSCALFRTLIRDGFHGPDLSKYISYMILIFTFVTPATPAFGAYLSHYFGWRSVFAFLTIYSLILLVIIIFIFKETSQHHHIDRLKMSFIIPTFKMLLSHHEFLGNSLSVLVTYGAFFSWVVVTPVLIVRNLGFDQVTYGWLSLVATSSMMGISALLNGRLVNKHGVVTMLRFGWSLMTLSGLTMLLGYYLFDLTLFGVLIPMMICFLGAFFIFPNTAMGAFAPFGKIAGYAGSAYGFLQTAGGALIAALVSYLPDQNQLPISVVILTCSILAWFLYEKIGKPATSRRGQI